MSAKKQTARINEVHWGASSVHPTGTVFYNPEKCWNGYTLLGSGKPRLVDMNGNLAHEWEGCGMPNRAMPGGRVITSSGRWSGGQQDNLDIQELDFEGNELWKFNETQQVEIDGKKVWIARQHHDFQREGMACGYYAPGQEPLANGKTLILTHRNLKNPKIHPTLQLLDDVMLEVDHAGKITWQWSVSDHFDELGFNADALKALHAYPPRDVPEAFRHADAPGRPGAGFDWFHQNCASYLGPNKWHDAGDARFHPDNIIINSRESCLFAIVEKSSGKIVWKVGPDYSQAMLEKLGSPIIGAHNVHMVPKGLPGAGNILLFDNGGQAGYGAPTPFSSTGLHCMRRAWSRVLELDPLTFEKKWEYRYSTAYGELQGHFDYRFFSPFVSSVQRLSNGNTMITAGDALRIFEITPEGETVWEYLVPYEGEGGLPLIYRASRLPYSWVPQLDAPAEVPVTPRPNTQFQIPNDLGVLPKI